MRYTVRLVPSLAAVDLSAVSIGDYFVLPNRDLFRLEAENQLGGIGSFFKKLAVIGGNIGGAFVGVPGAGSMVGSLFGGSGSSSEQAKGLAGITSYGNQVISAIQGALSGNVDASIVQQAEQLVNSLSDSSKVYQAKKGKDAEALAGFKSQAGQLLEQLRAKATQQQQAIVEQVQQQQQGQSSPSILGGINTNTIILIGGVFAVIYFFK